ncbi:8-amino-7-oxononanoate synthase [Paenibacillus sp. N4]|uniref:8-amino-7-oxononanoate synthase n=1 Tax=Paenibacillus vietnamensis TaxID=2590547 RepID=UPI001CD10AD8|nr:8-amino-7-oxononanoate synthase [Paenibacillus vietnamensis]MCA0756273.1 8-amino-7-oxononanoate synthase [Paenibacillus vietnamensis]
MIEWMEKELAERAGKSLERKWNDSARVAGKPGYLLREGREMLDLSSNDYLGLAAHPAIIEAMSRSLEVEGAGSGASRLVTGNRPPYRKLEEELAAWQGSGAALVFGCGYTANIGVISAVAGRGDVVFSDRLNHASIVDGITLSRAEHARYRHGDMEHLSWLLARYAGNRRKLIVTDAVFSMDGDCAPLQELVRIKKEHEAMLMVDEAHSGGIYGSCGEGLAHRLGISSEVDIHMGTFSKAFGVYGAYVSGSTTLIRWLLNTARPLIYSTGLPPAVVSGVSKALDLIQNEPQRRERLLASAKLFRALLSEAGLAVAAGDSPIIPVMAGDSAASLRFSDALAGEGIAAAAIRPPTVPEGTARIRFSLSASHTEADLRRAAEVIGRTAAALGLAVTAP